MANQPKSKHIPRATIQRLATYVQVLENFSRDNVEVISSNPLAEACGVNGSQVRKDLAYFGEFGTRGVGYRVEELLGYLTKILGLDQKWNIVIIGAGKLGSALALYQGFRERGFGIKAILDSDSDKVGEILADVVIEPMDVLDIRVKEHDINIGIITVPAVNSQDVTDMLVNAGVSAILNFSPRVLKVPTDVILRNVDLSVNLKVLSFNLTYNR